MQHAHTATPKATTLNDTNAHTPFAPPAPSPSPNDRHTAAPHLVLGELREHVERADRQPELARVRELPDARPEVHELVTADLLREGRGRGEGKGRRFAARRPGLPSCVHGRSALSPVCML